MVEGFDDLLRTLDKNVYVRKINLGVKMCHLIGFSNIECTGECDARFWSNNFMEAKSVTVSVIY
jgi:hypothetical protein